MVAINAAGFRVNGRSGRPAPEPNIPLNFGVKRFTCAVCGWTNRSLPTARARPARLMPIEDSTLGRRSRSCAIRAKVSPTSAYRIFSGPRQLNAPIKVVPNRRRVQNSYNLSELSSDAVIGFCPYSLRHRLPFHIFPPGDRIAPPENRGSHLKEIAPVYDATLGQIAPGCGLSGALN